MTATPLPPHLREDLLTPRFYTTGIEKAARTSLAKQRPELGELFQLMGRDKARHASDFLGCGRNLGVKANASLAHRLMIRLAARALA